MPYGQPTGQSHAARYTIQAQYGDTEISLVGHLDQGGGFPAEVDKDAAWQALVDLFAAAPGWTIIEAGRAYDMREDISPTTP